MAKVAFHTTGEELHEKLFQEYDDVRWLVVTTANKTIPHWKMADDLDTGDVIWISRYDLSVALPAEKDVPNDETVFVIIRP